jgi:Ala-tRNA(Pro) deacylase
MQVFVEEALAQDDEIAFNAGSHRELIQLAYDDFERLVNPTKALFAIGRIGAKAA